MANPLIVAAKGKGLLPMLARARAITGRYGLTTRNMEGALAQMLKVLEPFDARPTLPVTAAPLARSPRVAQLLAERGVELAVHGWKHVDHTLLSPEELSTAMQHAVTIFKNAGLRPSGFRSPYLRWNQATLAAVRAAGFTYDSSQALDWDVPGTHDNPTYRRALEFYGAQPAAEIPSLPRLVDGLLQIPYSLPDDEALVERLRLPSGPAQAEVWLNILACSHERGELFTLGLHPERAPLCREALLAVLQKAHSLPGGVWLARLDEIASWVSGIGLTISNIRAEEEEGRWSVFILPPPRAVIHARGLEVEGETSPAWGIWRQVPARFSFRCPTRPVIGLSPRCPAMLAFFLSAQGYLVETRAEEAGTYSCYLDCPDFPPSAERSLLRRLEDSDFPLVRVARWPGGMRSALAITGDVDAITFWDYAARILAR